MIVIKNRDLSKAYKALDELEEYDIKRSTAMQAALIYVDVEEIFREFNKQHSNIIQDHAEKDENGDPIPVLDENGEEIPGQINVEDPDAFQEEMEDLLEKENKIHRDKIPLNEFPEKISSGIMRGCLPIIDMDQSDDEEETEEDTED